MKILKSFTSLLLIIAIMFTVTSCVIVSGSSRHDNGLHKGWYKSNGNGNSGKGKGRGH